MIPYPKHPKVERTPERVRQALADIESRDELTKRCGLMMLRGLGLNGVDAVEYLDAQKPKS